MMVDSPSEIEGAGAKEVETDPALSQWRFARSESRLWGCLLNQTFDRLDCEN